MIMNGILCLTTPSCLTHSNKKLKEDKNIGIISEAGCPGVADPGQALVAIAQEMNAEVKPLVGPNSILLALMASGMNGQQFQFHGLLTDRQSATDKSNKRTGNRISKEKLHTNIY